MLQPEKSSSAAVRSAAPTAVFPKRYACSRTRHASRESWAQSTSRKSNHLLIFVAVRESIQEPRAYLSPLFPLTLGRRNRCTAIDHRKQQPGPSERCLARETAPAYFDVDQRLW